MFHAKDNKQGYIFDPFEYLGPKRLSELKNSWAEFFLSEILPELPFESLRKYYHDKNGRPSKEMYSMLGLLILLSWFTRNTKKQLAILCSTPGSAMPWMFQVIPTVKLM